eukprot:3650943-Rhodomonas_salina.1
MAAIVRNLYWSTPRLPGHYSVNGFSTLIRGTAAYQSALVNLKHLWNARVAMGQAGIRQQSEAEWLEWIRQRFVSLARERLVDTIDTYATNQAALGRGEHDPPATPLDLAMHRLTQTHNIRHDAIGSRREQIQQDWWARNWLTFAGFCRWRQRVFYSGNPRRIMTSDAMCVWTPEPLPLSQLEIHLARSRRERRVALGG